MQVSTGYLHCDVEENKGKYHHVKKIDRTRQLGKEEVDSLIYGLFPDK